MEEAQEPEEENIYYAPHLPRLFAFIIDFMLASIIASLVLSVLGASPQVSPEMTDEEMMQAIIEFQKSAYMWVIIGIFIGYFALFQVSSWQATPGKKLMGLYVTNLDGEPLSIGQSVWRAAVEVGNFIILLGLPAILALFHPYGQTAHDVIAKTYVLKR